MEIIHFIGVTKKKKKSSFFLSHLLKKKKMSNGQVVQDTALFINSTIHSIYELVDSVPGSHLVISYLKTAYQNDPFRVALELFLVFFAMKYMFSRKYKPNDNNVVLTEKVINQTKRGGIFIISIGN